MTPDLMRTFGLLGFMLAVGVLSFFTISWFSRQLEHMRQQFGLELDSRLHELRVYWDTQENLQGFSLLGSVVFGAIGFALPLGMPGVVIAGVAGWWAPILLRRRTQRKRMERLGAQLVVALTTLADGMRAGESFTQAVESAQSNSAQPMSQELSIISGQVRLGVSLSDALENFAARVPLPDVRIATQAIRISLTTGTSLPYALKQIAETIRNRMLVQGKIEALTAQGRAQGIVAGAVPFALAAMFYVVDPEYMSVLFDTTAGNLVVAFVIVLQVAAFFVIRNIVRVDI
jgi:tight adherence protein B